MKIYKYIATTKAKDAQGNKPTHYLKAKLNQGDKESEFVASLWSKEFKNQDGTVSKFLSGEMKAQYTDHTDPKKSRKGYVIVEEVELNRLLILEQEVNGTDTPVEPQKAQGEEEIPF